MLPEPLRTQVTAIKQEFAKRYHSRHALRSPPHVTLFPPFRWPTAEVDAFESLRDFCGGQAPVPLRLNGFGCFAPRVIFVRPEKTDALLDLQRGLQAHLGTQLDLVDPMAGKRRFSPHVTVAFRDLSLEHFRRGCPSGPGRSAWPDRRPGPGSRAPRVAASLVAHSPAFSTPRTRRI